jgi:hypothetical protein
MRTLDTPTPISAVLNIPAVTVERDVPIVSSGVRAQKSDEVVPRFPRRPRLHISTPSSLDQADLRGWVDE